MPHNYPDDPRYVQGQIPTEVIWWLFETPASELNQLTIFRTFIRPPVNQYKIRNLILDAFDGEGVNQDAVRHYVFHFTDKFLKS